MESKYWKINKEVQIPKNVEGIVTYIGRGEGESFIEMTSKRSKQGTVSKTFGVERNEVFKIREVEFPQELINIYGTYVSSMKRRKETKESKDSSRAKRIKLAVDTAEDKSSDEIFMEYENNNEVENLMDFSTIMARIKHKKDIEKRRRLKEKAASIVWRPWQQHIINIIESEPHDRHIYLVLDPKGNTGKSFFTKNYGILNNKVLQMTGGSTKDMALVASKHPDFNTVIIDVARKALKEKSYEFSYAGVEGLKNGLFSSMKYNSTNVINEIPHVFLFTNDVPDFTQQSEDRWQIIFIDVDGTTIQAEYASDILKNNIDLNEMSHDELYTFFRNLNKEKN